jgi:signal transduction histidine kinase
VVEDLLLLSKVGDPDNPVIPAPVDLRRIVDDVVDLTSVAAERQHITLSIEAPREPVLAVGDHDELDRVCANLVSNAVKYTPDGGHVTVELAACGDEILLQCADDGLGISPEDQSHLFDEFFRSSNPDALSQPGTGLGLAIVSRIVQRHKGRIELDSALGRGSVFRVLLPAAPA